MPPYSLKIDQQQRRLRTSARDRDEALAIFGKELHLKLTLEEPTSFVAVYLLNESESDTHLLGDTTRVFATPI
jgi:hypothetical protein